LIFILQQLHEKGFMTRLADEYLKTLLSSLYQELESKLAREEFLPRGAENGYLRVAYKSILGYQSPIRRKVEEKIGILPSFTVDEFNSDVVKLANDLACGALPSDFWNESGENKSASFASILNAGWLGWLTRIDEFYSLVSASSSTDKLKALDNFSELLLKAVESSYILNEWRKWQGGRGS
jgi:hypothetical protein